MTTIITKEQIAQRIKQIAQEIGAKYIKKPLTLIGVLHSGVPFLVDLMRELSPTLDVQIDYISVDSYGNLPKSSGVVTLSKNVTSDISKRYVILIDGIADAGHTLKILRTMFEQRALGCECACMLSQPSKREADVPVEYIGFKISDQYVIGYGMDAEQKYCNLPDICTTDK